MTEPRFNLIRADGTRITIPPTGLRLGRKSDNDVIVKGSNISRYHARILLAAGQCWIRDEGGALGTLLNGQFVPGQTEFKPGDTLHLGAEVFYLEKLEVPVPDSAPIQDEQPTEVTPTSRARLKTPVFIGLGIGLVAILVIVAFVTGILGGGPAGVDFNRYNDPYNVYSIDLPSTWEVQEGYMFNVYSAYMHDQAWVDEERGVVVIASPLAVEGFEPGMPVPTPEEMLALMVESGELSGLIEILPHADLQTRSIGGDPAAYFATEIEDDDIFYQALIGCIVADESYALFVAAFPQDAWDAQEDMVNHMFSSMSLE